jgi:predicted transcriptional regulator
MGPVVSDVTRGNSRKTIRVHAMTVSSLAKASTAVWERNVTCARGAISLPRAGRAAFHALTSISIPQTLYLQLIQRKPILHREASAASALSAERRTPTGVIATPAVKEPTAMEVDVCVVTLAPSLQMIEVAAIFA